MYHLPARFAATILTFTPVFLQQRTWRHAELLLIGAILAPGKRTVTSLLRITGLRTCLSGVTGWEPASS